MTEENFNYRTSQIMLRNQFPGEGPFKIPIIPKTEFSEVEFVDLRLIGFDRTHLEDEKESGLDGSFFPLRLQIRARVEGTGPGH